MNFSSRAARESLHEHFTVSFEKKKLSSYHKQIETQRSSWQPVKIIVWFNGRKEHRTVLHCRCAALCTRQETQHWQGKQTKKRKNDKCYFPHSIVLGKASLDGQKHSHVYVGAFVFLWQQWIINSCYDMCVLSERVLLEWLTFFFSFFFVCCFFSRWYAFRRFSVSHLHLLNFDNKTNRLSLRLQLTFDLSCQLPPGDVVRDSWVQ